MLACIYELMCNYMDKQRKPAPAGSMSQSDDVQPFCKCIQNAILYVTILRDNAR